MRLLFAAALACSAAIAADRDVKFFESRVAPILVRRCLPCHDDDLKNGDLSFATREAALRGGRRGVAIVPAKPGSSLLMETLRHRGDLQMPPGPALPSKEIRVLEDWIRRGAVWGRAELREK